uniref:Uncharacterized protein n=1 Tax=Rhizophora mucronata TaxID=61149 RepID=A0A2P2N998_RHIMU
MHHNIVYETLGIPTCNPDECCWTSRQEISKRALTIKITRPLLFSKGHQSRFPNENYNRKRN